MPIPQKTQEETSNEFLNRCMDNEKMKEEYPDEEQRFAVCVDQVKTLRVVRKQKDKKIN